MKIFLLFLFLLNINIFSQPLDINYSNWLFGKKAGITFNTSDSIPVEIFENIDELKTEEGISTFSDKNGNLQLSCNGIVFVHFYDKTDYSKFKVFQLGVYKQTGSSTNSNIIIQSMENPNQFYVFFAGDNQTNNNFAYRLFDVSLDNGKGDWVDDFEIIYDLPIAEKITAIYDYNYNFYWILIAENLPYNGFHILLYKLDKNGLQKTPQKFDQVIDRDLFGSMKFSQNGKYLAYCSSREYRLFVYKFNFEDGTLSDLIDYQQDKYSFYSVDFSPNSKKVYVTARNENINRSELFQFDLLDSINDNFIYSRKQILEFKEDEEFKSICTFYGKTYITTNIPIMDIVDYNNQTNYLTVIENPNEDFNKLKFSNIKFTDGRFPIYGLITKPTIKMFEREYLIDKPNMACLGNDFTISVKSNYPEDFIAEIVRVFPSEKIIGTYNSLDSSIQFTDFNNYESPNDYLFEYEARIVTEFSAFDTVKIPIKFRMCCDNTVLNPQFNIKADKRYCNTVDYQTDMDFRANSSGSCPMEFDALGQLASSSGAELHHPNFYRQSKQKANMLIGDPLPNTPQRVWYQENPTRIGTRYKLTAYISNVEKIPRYIGEARQINFWLGVRNRNQDLVLNRIDNIQYDDGWIELSDEFIAEDNSTELAIWVMGESVGNLPSYGFSVDDISLIPLIDYDLEAVSDTSLCFEDSLTFNNKFGGEISSVEWTPTTGLDDPTSLNPIASPTESTTYSLVVKDKYFCEFQSNISVDVDECISNCTPNLSVFLSDKIVQIGDTFCIIGTYIPECSDTTILNKLEIYFEYDPKLMSYLSATSSTYSIVSKGDKFLLKLIFDNAIVKLNTSNEFSFCFRSLLGNSLNPDISVFSDVSTKESYNLIDYINSKIEYISCDQIFRQIDLITMTDFEAVLNIRNLSINLSTEEQGIFKFIVIDINGNIVKQQDYTTSKNEYNFEEIFQLDLSNLASGIYNIRMTSPSGKYYTKRIILVD